MRVHGKRRKLRCKPLSCKSFLCEVFYTRIEEEKELWTWSGISLCRAGGTGSAWCLLYGEISDIRGRKGVQEIQVGGWIFGKILSEAVVMHWHGLPRAQGDGGVTIPGGVQEPWGCGTEGRGQWTQWGWAGGWIWCPERFFPTLMIL